MPNLRRLGLSAMMNCNPQHLLQFQNFSTLEFPIDSSPNYFQILTCIGSRLKELILSLCDEYSRDDHAWFDVLKVIQLCPSLEYFKMESFLGFVDFTVPVVAKNLKLKRLEVSTSDFFDAIGFLTMLCEAPLLEEVEFGVTLLFEEIESMIRLISLGTMFQNLIIIDFTIFEGCHVIGDPIQKETQKAFEKMVKNIVSFCPKLKIVNIDYSQAFCDGGAWLDDKNELKRSIAPFLELLREV